MMNYLNLSEAQYGDAKFTIFLPILLFLIFIVFFDTGCIRHDKRKGTNQIQTHATELAGGTPTTTVKIQTYTEPPVLTIASPSKGNKFASSCISVYGTVSDNYGLPFSVTVNGMSASVSGNCFFVTGIALSGITNTIEAVATDSVGLSSFTTVSVTYQTAPTMSVIWVYPSYRETLTSTSTVAEIDFTDSTYGIDLRSLTENIDGNQVNLIAQESHHDHMIYYIQDLSAGKHTLVASVLNGQGLLAQTFTTFFVKPAITITGISPTITTVGQLITITGSGLDKVSAICLTSGYYSLGMVNHCMLGLIYLPNGGGISPKHLTHNSDGSISFYIPDNAITGDLVAGNALTASNHKILRIKPTILNVLPYDVGYVVVYNFNGINIRQYRTTNTNGQKIISIYAAGLSSLIKDDIVSLNGINCPVGTVESGGLIKALIPVGIHSGKLVVTVKGISSDPVILKITNEKTYVNSNQQNMSNSGPFTRSAPVNLPPLASPNSRTLPSNNAIVTMGPKTTGDQHPITTPIGSFTSMAGSSVINSRNYSNMNSGQTVSKNLKLTIVLSGAPTSISATSLKNIQTYNNVLSGQTASEKISMAAVNRKCDTGNYEACVDSFLYYIKIGDYRFYDFIKKLVLLKQGAAFLQPRCSESKNGKYCLMLGEMYLAGDGVVQDFSMALFNFHKACEAGNEVGCSEVAYMYEMGKGVAQDYAKAAFLYEKSCQKGDGEGCNNLGDMYYKGLGVSQDYTKAASFLQKACHADVVIGCIDVGNMYYTGKEVPRNYNSAISFFQKACSLGNGEGCCACGTIYLYAKDYITASSFYLKSCDLGNAVGCSSIGLMYFSGKGVQQDYAQAISLMKKGCDKGDIGGCMDLGNIYLVGQGGIAQNYSTSVSLFQKACDFGDVSGCISLGNMYYVGKGVTQDYSKAAQFYEKACIRGNGFSCNGLGFLYLYGKGQPQNYSKAILLFQKACDLGSKNGCRNLHDLQKRDSYIK